MFSILFWLVGLMLTISATGLAFSISMGEMFMNHGTNYGTVLWLLAMGLWVLVLIFNPWFVILG